MKNWIESKSAIRFFTGAPKNTSTLALAGCMGWIPGVVRCDVETISLYNQIVCMADGHLTRLVYEYDKTCIKVKNNWASNVRSICEVIGELESWQSDSIINLKVATEKLMDMYQSVWHVQVSQMSKLYLYRTLTNSYGDVPHLRTNMNKARMSLITQLKCGNLALEIELGRYCHISHSDRLCNYALLK